MAKQAKIPQTEWTRGGRDISNTAIPLYRSNLTRIDEYLQDPMARQQEYIDRYYGADTARNQDFLRAYNRAMGNTTAQNYAATTGGYTSSGQRAYDDQQRYYNDLASRLQDYGVTSGYNMASQDYINMLNANNAYGSAYALGKPYSQIEQQNELARQANRNWVGQGLSGIGSVLSAIPHPVTKVLGAGMMLGGNLATTDTSQAMAAIHGGTPADWQSGGVYGNAFQNIGNMDWTPVVKWWNKRKGSATGTTPSI